MSDVDVHAFLHSLLVQNEKKQKQCLISTFKLLDVG